VRIVGLQSSLDARVAELEEALVRVKAIAGIAAHLLLLQEDPE
jgi:hypothetical protein